MLVVLVLAGACGGSETTSGEEGEIIGVEVEGSIENGVLQEAVYVGTVVVRLSDGREITAACDETLFTDSISDYFFADDVSGENVVLMSLAVDPSRPATVVQDSAGEWEVTQIMTGTP